MPKCSKLEKEETAAYNITMSEKKGIGKKMKRTVSHAAVDTSQSDVSQSQTSSGEKEVIAENEMLNTLDKKSKTAHLDNSEHESSQEAVPTKSRKTSSIVLE